MRRRRAAKVLSFLMLVIGFGGAAARGQGGCPLRLAVTANATPPEVLWQADGLYWVSHTSPTPDTFDVLIVGDTLRLTPAAFPMLARGNDRPISNWRHVVFDARRIIVAMPLVFSSTLVEFRAEEVIWEAEGRVTLRNPPPAGRQDGLAITARRLDLSNAASVPFDFETDNWSRYPSNDSDVTPSTRWARSLSIHVGTLTPPSSDSPPDPWILLRTLSRDRWDVLRGGQNAAFSRRPYDLRLNDTGEAQYSSELASTMLWPSAFAGKVERVFSQNSYDPAAPAFFLSTIDLERYSNDLAAHERHQAASQTLARVASSVRRRVDLFGYPPEFVPRVKFQVLQEAFKQQFSATEQLALRSLEYVLGEVDSAASAAERDAQLVTVRARQDALRAELQALTIQGAPLMAAIETLRQEYEAEAANLEAFKAQVDTWAVAKNKSNEQRRDLAVAVDAIGLVGTVAVTAFASPAAGAVFAKGWSTVGGTVVKHQYGHDITSVQEATEAIQAGAKQGQAWAEFAQDAVTKWRALEMSGAQGKTVLEQAKLALAVIEVADKQVRAISERGRLASLAGSTLDLDPAWRARADAHGAAMSKINTAIAEKQLQLSAHLARVTNTLTGMQGLTALESALNAATPANAAQRAEMESFYGGLLSSLLSNLTTSYSNLTRAYSYYTRAEAAPFDPAPLRNSLITLQSRQLERLASEGQEVPHATVAMGELLQMTFDTYKNSLISMDSEVLAAYGKVMGGSRFDETWQFSSNSTDPVKNAFVASVDRLLGSLFASIMASNGGEKQASGSVPVPIYLFLSDPALAPEFLDELYVEAVKLSGGSITDSRIELSMVHPAYGDFTRGNSCFLVSFASHDARENALRFPAVLGLGGTTSYAGKAEAVYAPFPLRTNYELQIAVLRTRADSDFSSWKAPRVKGLNVRARYIRY